MGRAARFCKREGREKAEAQCGSGGSVDPREVGCGGRGGGGRRGRRRSVPMKEVSCTSEGVREGVTTRQGGFGFRAQSCVGRGRPQDARATRSRAQRADLTAYQGQARRSGDDGLYLAEGGDSNNLLGLSCRHVLIGSKEANIDYAVSHAQDVSGGRTRLVRLPETSSCSAREPSQTSSI